MSSILDLASQDYAPEQIAAWAQSASDVQAWGRRIRRMRPFVVECQQTLVGYADLQPDGHIDHFYVSGSFARRGTGRLLMRHLLQAGLARGVAVLTADVSRTAQPLFCRFGFAVVEFRAPVVRGVPVPNARMRCELTAVASDRGPARSAGELAR